MTTICGIDFGTSNSTVGILKDGTFAMVPVEGTHTTVPSAIFHPADGAMALYGRAGIEAYNARESGRLMRSLKSILGSSLVDEKTGVGGRYRTFEEILVGFLINLKAKAEAFAGERIVAVVMGRPVHFVDDNPAADRRAEEKLGSIARQAGFETVLFQYEPIAAALQFEQELDREELVFIADIGGGTSDFSVVRLGPSRRGQHDRGGDILANGGVRVGGTNLDTQLSLAAVMPLLGKGIMIRKGRDLPAWPFVDLATWHRIHTIAEPKTLTALRQLQVEIGGNPLFERYMGVVREQSGHLIAKRVEDAKIKLSAAAEAVIDLDVVEAGLAVRARRRGLDTCIAGDVERIAHAITSTLAAADVGPDNITSVFLTGGTSAVPAIRRAICAPFINARVAEGDLFCSVGHGLALDAQRRITSSSRRTVLTK
ncbi:MAG: Hsp70 family protein [Hyphomicrobium sp.]